MKGKWKVVQDYGNGVAKYKRMIKSGWKWNEEQYSWEPPKNLTKK